MNDENSSWRSIPQPLSKPAITPIAQKRRRFVLTRRILTVVAVLIVAGGFAWSGWYLSTHSKTFAPYAQEQNRTRLVFFSDGQLTEAWFDEKFPGLKDKGLLSIDIAGLQFTLLRFSQVLEARVERNFPSTLKITLRERMPIARLRLKRDGAPQTYYVARDGMLFAPSFYHPPATLPYLAGVSARETAGELEPLAGMDTLAELLEGLKANFGELYVQLSTIDLGEWSFPVSARTSVLLKTRSGPQLRFGPEKPDVQFARLKETLELLGQEKQSLAGKLIDLTYPDKVTVTEAGGKAPEGRAAKKGGKS